MGIFDQFKNSLSNQVSNAANSAVSKTVNNAVSSAEKAIINAGSNKKKSFTFNSLPKNLSELQALSEADLKDEFAVAALTVLALIAYNDNKDASIEMLNFLKGPQPLSPYEKQFLADRFGYQNYVAKSYIKGATPDNNYEVEGPVTIEVMENPYSRDQANEGYVVLWLQSGGADSPREIKLRNKPSTGQWFLWEQMLLGGIRETKASDPWA